MAVNSKPIREIIDIKFLLDPDEYEAVMKIREQKKKNEIIQKCKMEISFVVSDTIGKIGLEETKRIVRELNRELREFKSGGDA